MSGTDIYLGFTKEGSINSQPLFQPFEVQETKTPDARLALGNILDMPQGTTYSFKTPVDTSIQGVQEVTVVVTFPDGSTVEGVVQMTVVPKPCVKYFPMTHTAENPVHEYYLQYGGTPYTFKPYDGVYFEECPTSFKWLFYKSTFIDEPDLAKWDVSGITDMGSVFNSSQFNGDISSWDVRNVNRMRSMFERSQFNGDISNWNTSNVADMYGMFNNSQFNQDISQWEVSKVTNMKAMFSSSQFNQDISGWNVGNVVDMSIMFYKSQFNGDISNWNTSNVADMYGMFNNSQFNQDISSWCVQQITTKPQYFDDTTPTTWVDSMKPKWGQVCV